MATIVKCFSVNLSRLQQFASLNSWTTCHYSSRLSKVPSKFFHSTTCHKSPSALYISNLDTHQSPTVEVDLDLQSIITNKECLQKNIVERGLSFDLNYLVGIKMINLNQIILRSILSHSSMLELKLLSYCHLNPDKKKEF